MRRVVINGGEDPAGMASAWSCWRLPVSILFDTLFPSQRVTDFTNVTFTDDGGAAHHAYLAKPEGAGPHPGVLLIHEFFGLNGDIVAKADILAREGYTVLAVDAYGGKTTKQLLRAILFVTTTPQERISRNVDAGYAYLAGLEGVDPGRIGAAGFCFGGTQVMQLGTRNPDLAAAAIFYGSGPIQDPAELGVMGQNGPVLGIFGEQDQSIPVEPGQGVQAGDGRPWHRQPSNDLPRRGARVRACGQHHRAGRGAGCVAGAAGFPGCGV